MATKEDESGTEEVKNVYKLTGTTKSAPGERVDRIIIEGTVSDPQRYIDLGGEAEMTEAEAEDIRKRFSVTLRKAGEADDDNEADAPSVESKQQQQAAQAASTESAPSDTGTGATSSKSSFKTSSKGGGDN